MRERPLEGKQVEVKRIRKRVLKEKEKLPVCSGFHAVAKQNKLAEY